MVIQQNPWHPPHEAERTPAAGPTGPVIGCLCGVSDAGEPLVGWQGRLPVPARSVERLDRETLVRPESVGREVLLVFPRTDPETPVVVDFLHSPLEALLAPEPAPPACARVDGERVVIEGRREVVLRCGEGSITLRRDGKIVVRGTELLSRATRRNRIKGASVAIN